MGPFRNANATMLLASAANSGSNVILRLGIGVSQTRNHTHTNGGLPSSCLNRVRPDSDWFCGHERQAVRQWPHADFDWVVVVGIVTVIGVLVVLGSAVA